MVYGAKKLRTYDFTIFSFINYCIFKNPNIDINSFFVRSKFQKCFLISTWFIYSTYHTLISIFQTMLSWLTRVGGGGNLVRTVESLI